MWVLGIKPRPFSRISALAEWWWHTLLIPAFRRQRQMDLWEFEASLVHRMNSRTGSKATEEPYLEKQKQKKSSLNHRTSLPVRFPISIAPLFFNLAHPGSHQSPQTAVSGSLLTLSNRPRPAWATTGTSSQPLRFSGGAISAMVSFPTLFRD